MMRESWAQWKDGDGGREGGGWEGRREGRVRLV